MSSQTVTLDVREAIRNGGEPFSKIMSAVAQLHPDENLLLLAPFEPQPLFGVLAKQGFTHTAREIENGDWEVLFTRSGGSAVGQPSDHNLTSEKNVASGSASASRRQHFSRS